MHQIKDHEHDEVRKACCGWQCPLRWDRQKSKTESWGNPRFKGKSLRTYSQKNQANQKHSFLYRLRRENGKILEGSAGDGAKATELSKPRATERVSEGSVRNASQMEGGQELKPPMGNEAERRKRKAGMVTGKGNKIEGIFFFFHDRETQSCL